MATYVCQVFFEAHLQHWRVLRHHVILQADALRWQLSVPWACVCEVRRHNQHHFAATTAAAAAHAVPANCSSVFCHWLLSLLLLLLLPVVLVVVVLLPQVCHQAAYGCTCGCDCLELLA
jgi:hypothetical protein